MKEKIGKQKVLMAEPNLRGRLGRDGGARQTLARQYQFPFEFDADLDELVWQDDDRLRGSLFQEVVRKHTGLGTLDLGLWLSYGPKGKMERPSDEQVLNLVKELILGNDPGIDPGIKWTGYRITGTDNHRGYNTWTLWLFAKHPKTDTRVFSGDVAPNVLRRLRRSDETLHHRC